ncbi:MAG: endolytic transglycosylase MltG [Candidatus Aminicenantes bacterium]|nr:endolytic transglycosylase MltG [Candidatus Aminicenantes bacterium]
MKKIIISLIILFIIIAGIVGFDFYRKVSAPYKGFEKKVEVNIKQGSSVTAIAQLLYSKKIIANYYYFRLYYRLFFSGVHFKSGEYLFDKSYTMEQVIQKLAEGKVILYKITVKEGLTIEETAELLERQHKMHFERFVLKAKDFNLVRDIDKKAEDLEGYLFPDTYMVHKGMTSEDFATLMVKKFKENFTNSMEWRARELNMNIREIVTLASLIEKETSSREERFLISSVFHNRLRIRMALGCDPTIIYALKRDNKYDGKIGWDDLKYKSPYNTRIYRGLPPGPICSPGFASIEAALFPENTKYLYFVAKDRRTHYFSKTLNEHNRAVRKYIINKKRK